MLIVFGAALVSVLVEAFAPRADRATRSRSRSASSACSAAFVAVVKAANGDKGSTASGSIVVDGPTLFLQGTLLLLSVLGVLTMAERFLGGPAATPSPPQGATIPGSPHEAAATRAGLVSTEVFPLTLFAVGGMMLFPAAGDLLTMFVALEVLSLPLYILCGLARRRRLLSQEASLKYFLLGAFSSAFFLFGSALLFGYAGSLNLGDIAKAITDGKQTQGAAAARRRAGRDRPAVQDRRRAVPLLDARRLPGCADAGHRVHGRLHQAGGVRRDPAGGLRRRRPGRGGTGSRCSGASPS